MTTHIEIPYAVFVFAPSSDGLFAATTRPGLKNVYGLPGGKIDKADHGSTLQETLLNAIIREAKEEGWKLINVNTDIVYFCYWENKKTVWVTAERAIKLSHYKEKHRIQPIELPLHAIAPHYNNNNAIKGYEKYKSSRTS